MTRAAAGKGVTALTLTLMVCLTPPGIGIQHKFAGTSVFEFCGRRL